MDIEISILKKFIENKNIKKNNDLYEKNENEELNVIVENDFFFENNLKINNLIENISKHEDYFILINGIKNMNIQNQPIQNIYNNIKLDQEKSNFIIIDYKINNFSYFINFFKSLPNPKLFIYHIIDSYIHILNGLNILIDNDIFLFDLTDKNIIFDNTLKPKLINYELAMYNDFKKQDFFNILKKINNYSLKPIEIHLLFYLYNNDIEYISFPFISDIIDNFIHKIPFFDLFSPKYKEQYREEGLKFLNIFVNKPSHYVYDEIIKYKHTWSNYSLSIIYLYIIGNTIKTFQLKNTIINKMLLILNKNIYPNPTKRENISQTIEKMDILFGEYNNWDFIKKINNMDDDYYRLLGNL